MQSEVYREQIDKAKFMEHLSDRIENGLAPEKAISVADDRLTRHSQTTYGNRIIGEFVRWPNA